VVDANVVFIAAVVGAIVAGSVTLGTNCECILTPLSVKLEFDITSVSTD
jgi:hypothetical protein